MDTAWKQQARVRHTQTSRDEAYQVIVASSSSDDVWHRPLAFPNESHKLEDDA